MTRSAGFLLSVVLAITGVGLGAAVNHNGKIFIATRDVPFSSNVTQNGIPYLTKDTLKALSLNPRFSSAHTEGFSLNLESTLSSDGALNSLNWLLNNCVELPLKLNRPFEEVEAAVDNIALRVMRLPRNLAENLYNYTIRTPDKCSDGYTSAALISRPKYGTVSVYYNIIGSEYVAGRIIMCLWHDWVAVVQQDVTELPSVDIFAAIDATLKTRFVRA